MEVEVPSIFSMFRHGGIPSGRDGVTCLAVKEWLGISLTEPELVPEKKTGFIVEHTVETPTDIRALTVFLSNDAAGKKLLRGFYAVEEAPGRNDADEAGDTSTEWNTDFATKDIDERGAMRVGEDEDEKWFLVVDGDSTEVDKIPYGRTASEGKSNGESYLDFPVYFR